MWISRKIFFCISARLFLLDERGVLKNSSPIVIKKVDVVTFVDLREETITAYQRERDEC